MAATDSLAERLAARRRALTRARTVENRAANLAVALLFAGPAALLAYDQLGIGWPWLLGAWLGLLLLTSRWRTAATTRRRRIGHAVAWYERAAARCEDRWTFGQADGAAYRDPEHPYAGDLDVFGPGSLFERLNDCSTVLGRDALAAFLGGQPTAATPADRTAAIRELVADTSFREAFEIELREVVELPHFDARERDRLEDETRRLPGWGATPAPPAPSRGRVAAQLVMAALATFAVAAKFAFELPWAVVLPFYGANYLVLWTVRETAAEEQRFSRARATLRAWSRALALVEDWQPQAAPLRDRAGSLRGAGSGASHALRLLGRRVESLERRRNVVWQYTMGVIWLWDLHALRALHDWKRKHGPRLAGWLGAVASLEALAALAACAESLPEDADAVVDPEGPWFEAEDLAHALLPRRGRVGNDLKMPDQGAVLLVTGSNMSGKSTFLRAVGLAALLARLGMPVPARGLRMRELDIATCMRVEDSLREGVSRFHAEVKRLRSCVAAAEVGRPVLVLLDEILAGTNSRDRHLGTRAVLQRLAGLPAITLVSSHDLALAELADRLPERVRAVHFRDFVRNGRMEFDYRVRPGPLPESNALRVLRDAGLPVDLDDLDPAGAPDGAA
ncbi:MAG TPA: hypothetical protein VGC54_12895 [Planctomycetota bacterium]